MTYRTLEPELRNSFPAIWRGMDLRGMKVEDQFYGCDRCGVQFAQVQHRLKERIALFNQCPICLKPLSLFTVTHADVAVGSFLEATNL